MYLQCIGIEIWNAKQICLSEFNTPIFIPNLIRLAFTYSSQIASIKYCKDLGCD